MNTKQALAEAIYWIAANDGYADEVTVKDVSRMLTTLLVADLFRLDPMNVAKQVMRKRREIRRLQAYKMHGELLK